MPLVFSWVSFRQFWGLLRHSTGLLVVSFSRNCSVAVLDFEVRFPFLTMFVTLHHFSVLVGAYACFHQFQQCSHSELELSTDISRGCCQTTHWMGEMFFCWCPVCQSLLRSENVAILFKTLGCSPGATSYTVLCVLSLTLALPGKWLDCCIGSSITSLCGVVRFVTCLTG